MRNQQSNTSLIKIPTFDELKKLALKYEIFIDSKDPFDSDTSKIKIRDIKTGLIQSDKSVIAKALFANIWLTSAGMKYSVNESRPGEIYAFNEPAEKLYNLICQELQNDCKNKGVIDTVNLLRNIKTKNNYKYNEQIIVNLFRSPYQTELINQLFLNSQGKTQVEMPEPLYTMSYAGEILNGTHNNNILK